MSREKQIEEMAKMLSEDCGSCENCTALGATADGVDCTDYYYARALYNAGYRKQSEGAWMTYHCTNGGKSKRGRTIMYKTHTCDVCGKSNGRRKTPFCPDCGAKMRKEDEGK